MSFTIPRKGALVRVNQRLEWLTPNDDDTDQVTAIIYPGTVCRVLRVRYTVRYGLQFEIAPIDGSAPSYYFDEAEILLGGEETADRVTYPLDILKNQGKRGKTP